MQTLIVSFIVNQVRKLMFKKIRERMAAKAMTSMRGALTYSSVTAIVLPLISNFIGFEIVPADVLPIYQGVLALVAIFGRWRATR